MKQETSAGAVIYYIEENKRPKFLLLKYPTYWGFAKGWIEQDEKEEEAAIREVKEETGLKKIKIIPGFKHKQKWFFRFNGEPIKKEAVFFLIEVSKEQVGSVKISEEHEDFKWLSYEEAVKIMKIRDNKEMLEKAYDFVKEHKKQKTLA